MGKELLYTLNTNKQASKQTKHRKDSGGNVSKRNFSNTIVLYL